MPLASAMIDEFDTEMNTTRRLLERVPDAHHDWKPHPKSMSMGELAIHIATLPQWGVSALQGSEFDFQPEGAPAWAPAKYSTAAETLQQFDAGIAAVRSGLAGTSDAAMGEAWTLKAGKHVIFTMPRAA
nr:DinB family protein [Gemmatimonadaceae bacterium]